MVFKMDLKRLIPQSKNILGSKRLKIKGISDDSRCVGKGDLFFVTNKRNFNIFSVLKEVEKKALAFVADAKQKSKILSIIKNKPVIIVKNIDKEFLRVANRFYGFKKSNVKCIGVTGTNGKTTTTSIIYHLLSEMGQSPSLIGTVKYLIGSTKEKADYTTPDFLRLRKILNKIEKEKSNFVVIEVSSHALKQKRTRGVEFTRCVFTNLSRDHLDYHRTIKDYFKSKEKLFLDNKNKPSFINSDDAYGRRLIKKLPKSISYGIRPGADFRARRITLGKKKTYFDLVYKEISYPVVTNLIGVHNILNILGAISVVSSLGFPLSKLTKAVVNFRQVQGRLQEVAIGVFIDYAHTPSALASTLSSLAKIGYKRIICVFGCGGDRDKGKRKLMGQIVSKKASFAFITSDNPRSECPESICCQIAKGFYRNNYKIVINRKEAISRAWELFKKYSKLKNNLTHNTCLLVAGKGHENYQIIGDRRLPFKDSKVLKKLIKK